MMKQEVNKAIKKIAHKLGISEDKAIEKVLNMYAARAANQIDRAHDLADRIVREER